jgi:steroid delta-isomerase-like uncharacterized protein
MTQPTVTQAFSLSATCHRNRGLRKINSSLRETIKLLRRSCGLCVGILLALSSALWSVNAAAEGDPINQRLVEQEAAGWSSGNLDQLLSVFTDDVTYEDVPLGLVLHGKEELRAFAKGFFNGFPDLKAAIVTTVVSGDRGASEWTFAGTQTGDMPNMPASNKRMDLRGMSTYEFASGKIKRKIDYWDVGTMMRQLGFAPAKP